MTVVTVFVARKLTDLLQLVEAFKPTTLEIHNDSHLHSHHKAMEGVESKETHFRFAFLLIAIIDTPLNIPSESSSHLIHSHRKISQPDTAWSITY